MSELLTWKCPDCGLTIQSLYQAQFDHNVQQHKGSHDRKNGK